MMPPPHFPSQFHGPAERGMWLFAPNGHNAQSTQVVPLVKGSQVEDDATEVSLGVPRRAAACRRVTNLDGLM